MEFIAEHDQFFPTSTPVLDVLRPVTHQQADKLSTGHCVFISSAVILAFITMPTVRSLPEAIPWNPVLLWGLLSALPFAALLLAMAVHDGGHLLAARLTGFETVQWKFALLTFRSRRFRQSDYPEQVFSMGNLVITPRHAERLRKRLTCLVAAGPLNSFLSAVLLETGSLALPQDHTAGLVLLRFALHLGAAVSLLVGMASMVPDLNSAGQFSDGARLLMLLKNDALAGRWLAIAELQVALNSGLHPRAWDAGLLTAAATDKDESLDATVGSWLAYRWALGRQDIALATRHLEETLTALAYAPNHLRDRIFTEAAAFQAWFRHNPVKGRFWASQIRNPRSLSALQKMRMDIALRWSEGRPFDAWEELGGYILKVREMPASPFRDLTEMNALEWKGQMESRMLSGAWATLHSLAQRQREEQASAERKHALESC